MIVDMIAGEVGEQCPVKIEPGDTFLGDGVTADLHESIGAAGIDHATQEPVQLNRVRRGMRSRNGFVFDIIDHGRE